jgi:hypothetical protein
MSDRALLYAAELARALGAEISPAQDLSGNPGISECPSVAVAGDTVLVAWEDGTAGNHEIFLARSPA